MKIRYNIILITLFLSSCIPVTKSVWTSGVKSPEFKWVDIWDASTVQMGQSMFGTLDSVRVNDVEIDQTGNVWVQSDTITCLMNTGDFLLEISWKDQNPGFTLMDMALDKDGNVYVITTSGNQPDLDPGPQVEKLKTAEADYATCLIKLGKTGKYLWGKTWNGVKPSGGSGIGGYNVCCDPDGNVYTSSISIGEPDGPTDGFGTIISSYDPSGTQRWRFIWKPVAGSIVATKDSLYITGMTMGDADMDPGKGEELVGMPSGFLTRIDLDGSYKWSHIFPSNQMITSMYDVDVDDSGNAYVVGSETDGGQSNKYWGTLNKIDSDGNEMWSEKWGDNQASCFTQAVKVNKEGNIIIGGVLTGQDYGQSSVSVDMDPGKGTDYRSFKNHSMFISKFNPDGDFQWAAVWGDQEGNWLRDLSVDTSGAIYVAGSFAGKMDFDLSDKAQLKTSKKLQAFLLKMME
jgi:hypothetical protein